MRTPLGRTLLALCIIWLLAGVPAPALAALPQPSAAAAAPSLDVLETQPTALLPQAAPAAGIQVPTTPLTFTVNSSGDEPDASPGNGVCATAGGLCTFRAAINEINARSGGDTIRFAINPSGAALPRIINLTITDTSLYIRVPVSIIGPNQGGAEIWLDGSGTSGSWSGLSVYQTSNVRIANLVIGGFPAHGVYIYQSSFVTVTGVTAGSAGLLLAGNFSNGINLSGSSNCLIGGTTAGARNILSGNGNDGLYLSDAMTNTIQGNYIGLSYNGTDTVPNTRYGIYIFRSSNNLVGGSTAGARNVVAGNGGANINIRGESGKISENNRIQGNYIGLLASGAAAAVNGAGGVILSNYTRNNLVGGSSLVGTGEGNVISGNDGSGVAIYESSLQEGNLVQGNLIGTDANGTFAVPNTSGIYIGYSSNNTIGGATPDRGNLVSGNNSVGIYIRDGGTNNKLHANRVGLSATGTPLGNGSDGIRAWTMGNLIGNTTAGPGTAGNTVAYNGGCGIQTNGPTTMYGNRVFGNGLLELDYLCDGVTPNDSGTDIMPQNYPELTGVVVAGSTVTITGYINTNPSASIVLEFFISSGYDPSGCGQAEDWVGTATITTNAGDTPFTAVFTNGAVRPGVYAATATSVSLGTSEFSCAPSRVLIPLAQGD